MTQTQNVHAINPNPSISTYEVGYKKPPVASRFKPGNSGNPKGRKKNSRNIVTLLRQELDEPVFVTENGKKIKLTKREVLVKQIFKKALMGDLKCLDLIIRVDEAVSPSAAAVNAVAEQIKVAE